MTDYPSVSHIVEKLTLVGIAVLVFEGAFAMAFPVLYIAFVYIALFISNFCYRFV